MLSKFRQACLGVATVGSVLAFASPSAQALTLLLDFTTTNVTENAGVGTSTISQADFSTWGFSSMNLAQIQEAVLVAVTNDYLMFPTFGTDALSPLADGKMLNISFELTTSLSLPTNGDTEYFYFGVGNTAGGGEDELGHACYGCVRDNSMTAAAPNGTMVGVNFTDNLQGLTSLATTDAERINILAGTISHEFGHALMLDHPSGALANPGASSFSIMATGAAPTSMPNSERLTDRAFSYTEFQTLINTVGVRDIAPIPEPGTYAMLLLGLGVLGVARKRAAAQQA